MSPFSPTAFLSLYLYDPIRITALLSCSTLLTYLHAPNCTTAILTSLFQQCVKAMESSSQQMQWTSSWLDVLSFYLQTLRESLGWRKISESHSKSLSWIFIGRIMPRQNSNTYIPEQRPTNWKVWCWRRLRGRRRGQRNEIEWMDRTQ